MPSNTDENRSRAEPTTVYRMRKTRPIKIPLSQTSPTGPMRGSQRTA
jgi:hypothetical protein